MAISERRDGGGMMMRCLRMSRSISERRSFGRGDKSNKCFVVFIVLLCVLVEFSSRKMRVKARQYGAFAGVSAKPAKYDKAGNISHSMHNTSNPAEQDSNFRQSVLAS
jgi:hypothetical protein